MKSFSTSFGIDFLWVLTLILVQFGSYVTSFCMFFRDWIFNEFPIVLFYRFWNKMIPKVDARAIPFCSLFRPCSAMGALGSALFVFEGPLVHFGFLLAPILLFLVPFWFHFGNFPRERFICCRADVCFSTLFTSLSTLGLCALFDLICWHIVDSCGSLRVAFFVDLGTLGDPGILPDSHLAYLYIYIYVYLPFPNCDWVLASFRVSFLRTFHILLHHLFEHEVRIDLSSILGWIFMFLDEFSVCAFTSHETSRTLFLNNSIAFCA